MQPTWVTSLVFALASCAVFALVARTVHRRPVSPEARAARNAFVTWWACLSAVSLMGALLLLPFVPLDASLFLEATIASLLLLCVGLWGLQYYLVYLYTSNRSSMLPLALGYLALFGLLLLMTLKRGPFHVEAAKWGPRLQGTTDLAGTPAYWLVIVLFIVPTLVAAAAYLSLYRKTPEPVQRRRILLVGLSLLVWFGTGLGASIGKVALADWWQVASRIIALAAAGTIYYAYAGLEPAPPAALPTPATPPPYLAGDPLDPRRRVATP
ncbi:MAG TPA: hypothetical protein VHI93_01310 [Candidatus Thermoplasmatota archaeon]|nr:hypothetical protein [Candidatus Thermoplasmatota archaeon]